MRFGAFAFGKRFRLYSIGTLLVCLVAAALTGLYIPRLVANEPTPWMGVYERINIFGYLLWASVLAIGLLRAQRTTAPRQEEKPTVIPQAVAR
jgi:hypothetical protein